MDGDESEPLALNATFSLCEVEVSEAVGVAVPESVDDTEEVD